MELPLKWWRTYLLNLLQLKSAISSAPAAKFDEHDEVVHEVNKNHLGFTTNVFCHVNKNHKNIIGLELLLL